MQGYASVYSTDSEEEAERPTAKAALGTIARRRFQAMLRCMSGKRVEIARAMEFALKRAEAADEVSYSPGQLAHIQVSDLICQSLRIDSTPVPRKMARLHLISDILHNSVRTYTYALANCRRPHSQTSGGTANPSRDSFRQSSRTLPTSTTAC